MHRPNRDQLARPNNIGRISPRLCRGGFTPPSWVSPCPHKSPTSGPAPDLTPVHARLLPNLPQSYAFLPTSRIACQSHLHPSFVVLSSQHPRIRFFVRWCPNSPLRLGSFVFLAFVAQPFLAVLLGFLVGAAPLRCSRVWVLTLISSYSCPDLRGDRSSRLFLTRRILPRRLRSAVVASRGLHRDGGIAA
jgi:hypothetical protein